MKKRRHSVRESEEEIIAEEIWDAVNPHVPKKTYREFEEILVIEFISVTGGVIAGAILAQFLGKIALVPGLLILLPGFLAMRGNISGSMAARIGAALHVGLLKHHKQKYFLHSNVWAAFVLSIVVSFFLGVVAWLGTRWFFGINSPDIILVALIASVISNIILIPITTRTTIWLFRHGYDPDNIMAPYITTIGDIVSVASLIIAILVV